MVESETLDYLRQKLDYLLDREAIREVVANYARGVDRLDRDLLMSAYHPDAVDDHAGFVGDREELWDFVSDLHGTFHRVTQHYIANHSAEIDGDTAHSETYYILVAVNNEGQPFTLLGGRYIDRLERREGKWAIVQRMSLGEWAAPSINTVEGAATSEGGPNRRYLQPFMLDVIKGQDKAARGPDDPSYRRPLTIPLSRRQHYQDLKGSADA